jgi:isopentenyl phosphate kinase
MPDLILLKLGGSVITDKSRPFTAQEDVVRRLGREIQQAKAVRPGLQVVIGHGSGSFGHVVAHRYHTHEGILDDRSWQGFAETARAAASLNRLVTDWLFTEGVPVVSFSPVASARCRGKQLLHLEIQPLEAVLQAGLMPIVYGDVAIDESVGFTIVSTEQIFEYLAHRLRPVQIVLAGVVDGVYDADPLRRPDASRIERITPVNWPQVRAALGASHATDVTGGMLSKVQVMVNLAAALPGLRISVVSGAIPGRVHDALTASGVAGTEICGE